MVKRNHVPHLSFRLGHLVWQITFLRAVVGESGNWLSCPLGVSLNLQRGLRVTLRLTASRLALKAVGFLGA